MLGAGMRTSLLRTAASRLNPTSGGAALAGRNLSSELKVSSVEQSEERIRYFKIYRWDPDHQQKPVSPIADGMGITWTADHILASSLSLLTPTLPLSVSFDIPGGPERLRAHGARRPH